jgi:hypothetical protein
MVTMDSSGVSSYCCRIDGRKAYSEEHETVAGEGDVGDCVGCEAEEDEAEDELQDADGDEARSVARDMLAARGAFCRHGVSCV